MYTILYGVIVVLVVTIQSVARRLTATSHTTNLFHDKPIEFDYIILVEYAGYVRCEHRDLIWLMFMYS